MQTFVPWKRSLFCFSAASRMVLTAPPAPSFSLAEGETERDAELLVVGNYPAKGLKVTEADLDDIVAQFSEGTVPIRIEHIASPLDPLGVVSRLWRDGKRLMGKIAFDPLAAPLIAKRAVRGLSVGLDYLSGTAKLCLSEVSLTLRPHVATAALLADDTRADDDRVSRLEARLASLDADARIRELKRAGKLTPAAEPPARQLLSCPDGAAITLADGSTRSVAEAAYALLSALPAAVKFTETAAATKKPGDGTGQEDLYGDAGGDDLPELTPDQYDYCVHVLKVDPMQVRRTMQTTRRIGTSDAPKRGG